MDSLIFIADTIPSDSMNESGILGLILAREGSRGVPKKNIYPVAGKPLIAWTIEAARASTQIDRVIVSTDGQEIASVARAYGAETPFMRPRELAQDDTPDLPAFQHALSWLKEHERYEPALIVQLWATSPYRRPADIDAAITLLQSNNEADSVRSVTHPSQTPFKMWRRDKGPYLYPLLRTEYPEAYERAEPYSLPRQTLPEVLVQTGYVSVVRTRVILGGSMYGKNVLPFYHEPDTYTEIDSQKDLAYTEELLKSMQKTI